MIPVSNLLNLTVDSQPDKTYYMHISDEVVNGSCSDLEEVKQAIFKILNTERYRYAIYSWNYGIETYDLYGKPVCYVCAEIERRVMEALVQDDRIEGVSGFEFDITFKCKVHVSFVVSTIYGDVEAQTEVEY